MGTFISLFTRMFVSAIVSMIGYIVERKIIRVIGVR